MRGHWIGGTRKLNKHWQSGEGSIAEFSRWFTTIKYDNDYYCFAPSYEYEKLPKIELREAWGTGWRVKNNLKEVWTSLGTVKLTPSFNNKMNAVISYDLEDIRENGQITTRNLSPSDIVKVIVPTFSVSVFIGENTGSPIFRAGYTYNNIPTVPVGAEILWQNDTLLLSYESRYSDNLNLLRNTWNAWQFSSMDGSIRQDIEGYTEWDDLLLMQKEYIGASLLMCYYDHVNQSPIAQNLMSPIMYQKRTGIIAPLMVPFNEQLFFWGATYDYEESKDYQIWYKLDLVQLDLEERTIV